MKNEFSREFPAGKHAAVLVCIAVIASLACSLAVAGKQQNPYEGDPDTIVAGAKLYLPHCASCHGRMAQFGRAPDLTDDYWMYGDGARSSSIPFLTDGPLGTCRP